MTRHHMLQKKTAFVCLAFPRKLPWTKKIKPGFPLEKICLFFFKFNFFFLIFDPKSKNVCSSKLKIGFVITIKILIKLEKNQIFYFFRILKENLTFQKVPCFTVKWVVWIFWTWHRCLYCQCDYFRRKIFVKLLLDHFWWNVEVHQCVDH